MAKDYAKARSKKKQSNSGTSRFSLGLLWLFIGVMVGLLIPSFGYIKQHVTTLVQGKKPSSREETLLRDPLPQKVKTAQQTKKIEKEKIEEAQPINNEDNVDFDFYTILPSEATKPPPPPNKTLEDAEQKLLAPTENAPKKTKTEDVALPPPQIKTTAPATAPTTTPTPKPTANKPVKGYILQLGSFKTFEEADQLKAQLSLVGLEAKIKQTTINGITRQRVWIGIYPSLEAAEKAQQKLADSGLKSSLAQVK